jgi:hypothetical protein
MNGFVNEFTFNKEGYKLSTIFKSSLSNMSDSLVYEYYVGSYFINLMMPYFPCFVETFNIYSYETTNSLLYNEIQKNIDTDQYKHIIDLAKTSLNNLQKNSISKCIFNTELLLESYLNPTKQCILIQHINKPTTLYDFIYRIQPKELNKWTKWGLHLFLQIYNTNTVIGSVTG